MVSFAWIIWFKHNIVPIWIFAWWLRGFCFVDFNFAGNRKSDLPPNRPNHLAGFINR